MDSEMKQVLVMVHNGTRRGKMIAQGAHAAMMIFLEGSEGFPAWDSQEFHEQKAPKIEAWVRDSGMKKVTLYVRTIDELLAIVEKAKAAGLEVHTITDSGHTEFHGRSTLTCCAIGPDLSSKIDEVTGDLPLL